MKKLLLAFALLITVVGAAVAAEKPRIGGAFQVVDVSGPNKGNQLCYY